MNKLKPKLKPHRKYRPKRKVRIFDGLIWKVSRTFICCFILFSFANMVFALVFQVGLSINTMTNHLENVGEHLQSEELADGSEFHDLVDYYKVNHDKIEVAADFEGHVSVSEDAFETTFMREHPGMVYGKDVLFGDLSEDLKLLWANWTMEYWFTEFKNTAKDFDLSFIYFVYPTEEEYTVCYMFDPTYFTKVTDDGREVLRHGDMVYEDPKIHENMWKTVETGKATGNVDFLDNEYGTVYTYCYPLYSKGDFIGLVCIETDSEEFATKVLSNVWIQLSSNIVMLLIIQLIVAFALYRRIIKRIRVLEKEIITYSDTKDSAVANEIIMKEKYRDEIASLGSGFASMIKDLDDYMNNLTKVTAEKERIGAELDVATGIQISMLPRIFPAFPERSEFDIYASMDPAKEVGGDFYDFFMVDSTHLAIVIADVSGKGVPAALFMVIAKTILKNNLLAGDAVEEALIKTNDQLAESNDEMLFVTAWVGVIDLTTGLMDYSDAGHESAFVIGRESIDEIVIEDKLPPLAIMDGMEYNHYTRQLHEGEKIFIYTDGVPEANSSEKELYGMDRLRDVMFKCLDKSPRDVLIAVRKDVDDFVGEAEQFDDLTMLCVEIKKLNKDD